jgi:hypothetical protein
VKTKKILLGQHGRYVNVSMPCVIPKKGKHKTIFYNIKKNLGKNRRMHKEREILNITTWGITLCTCNHMNEKKNAKN